MVDNVCARVWLHLILISLLILFSYFLLSSESRGADCFHLNAIYVLRFIAHTII